MATISRASSSAPPHHVQLHRNSIPVTSSSSWNSSLNIQFCRTRRVCALKTEGGRVSSSQHAYAPGLLKKPVVVVSQPPDRKEEEEDQVEEEERDGSECNQWVDWEDKILEDTVPLVGFVRTILHSGKYKNGDRLGPEHEKTILERLLPYHPSYETKIGCGVESIMIGYHPEFKETRCMFVVRKDGELVDFSYWKCIKGLIRKKYPLFADSFILRHFRRRRHGKI
ncbi:protein DCL homolog, chloroplastic [Ziziphus jujuba]|uniref:Protein DCL homolog, chloroplastic n=2 Tax=Ziziphus jujuba TaxID=326968 RepID=A0A6P4A8Q4_ZIZJJ|nr:protein DCL homolog, chloroplastic [Ziziphus jujuba]KAH7520175.1 hypothetical protein FEM48_Zijuj08G0116500 [Ziziphus jujuba var. spinosa]